MKEILKSFGMDYRKIVVTSLLIVLSIVRVQAVDPVMPDIALLDRGQTIAKRLETAGHRVVSIDNVSSLGHLPSSVRLIIVGPNQLQDPDSKSTGWRRIVESGVNLLVLEQYYPSRPLHGPAVPVDTWLWESNQPSELDDNSVNHPIFARVGAPAFEQLSTPDKFIFLYGTFRQRDVETFDPNGKEQYRKRLVPDNILSLGTSREASIYTPVLVYPAGKGWGILCQLPVGEKLATDATAGLIFDNMVNFILKGPN